MTTIADRYEVIAEIGRGGMGVVYLAEDARIGRKVALKQLSLDTDAIGAEEAVQRFMREARLTGRLHHPNIVTLFDVIEEEGDLYLVLEYYESRSLADVVEEDGPLSEEEVRAFGGQIAGALDAAHAEGVIHRDIKPENILIGATGAKLTDFGIARFAEGAQGGGSRITRTGFYVGTAGYMAPEQLTDQPPTHLSDVFSVGVVLCYSLTGRDPFGDGPLPSVVYKIVNEEIDLSDVECSADMRTAILAATAKTPDLRPEAGELAALLAGSPAAPAAPAAPESHAAHAAPAALEPHAAPAAPATSGSSFEYPSPGASGEYYPAAHPQGAKKSRTWLKILVALLVLFVLLIGLGIAGRIARGGASRRVGGVGGTTVPTPTQYSSQLGYRVTIPAGWAAEYEAARSLDRFGPPGSQTAVTIKKMPAGSDPVSMNDAALLALARRDVASPSQYSLDEQTFVTDRSATYGGNAAVALSFNLVDATRQAKLRVKLYRFATGETAWAALEQVAPGEAASAQAAFAAIEASFST